MESYSHQLHYSHSPQLEREKLKGIDHHHRYAKRASESDLDTISHNNGEWYQSKHWHHQSHHDGYHYYSDSDTDIQPSSHRSHHLDRDRDYENDSEKNKKSITHGCTSGQKHKRDYSSGNKSNSNDIPPHGSIEKMKIY